MTIVDDYNDLDAECLDLYSDYRNDQCERLATTIMTGTDGEESSTAGGRGAVHAESHGDQDLTFVSHSSERPTASEGTLKQEY